jgi:hypothetical protein
MKPIRVLLITTAVVAFTASAVWKPQSWQELVQTIETTQDRIEELERNYCQKRLKESCRLLEDDRVFLKELRGEIGDQISRGDVEVAERLTQWSEKLRDFLAEFRQTEVEIRSSRY